MAGEQPRPAAAGVTIATVPSCPAAIKRRRVESKRCARDGTQSTSELSRDGQLPSRQIREGPCTGAAEKPVAVRTERDVATFQTIPVFT